MAHESILAVEDDEDILELLKYNLSKEGYQVSVATTGEEGLQSAGASLPDLILLDLMLPEMDGLEVCRQLKADQKTRHLPIIMLTAKGEEADIVTGLELGADDYITKPFDNDVLLARIKVALRRAQASNNSRKDETLAIGDLTIDPAAHVVTLGGKEIDLPPREFDLLHALALEAGSVVSVDDLLTRVWGAEYMGESQVVYVHIRWLREKLEKDPHNPKHIITVRGVGYKLESQE
jgi:two-component system alkaline phosphatase synthesis response regulator PhoP